MTLLIGKRHGFVTETSYGYQVAGFGRRFLDIPAQSHNEIIDGARVRILEQIANVLEDRSGGAIVDS